MEDAKLYRVVGADGAEVLSPVPGTLGGHRRTRGYGRLDCPVALRWIAKGQYVRHRVFFADEETAIAAGYRPCAVCMPDEYREWKAAQPSATRERSSGSRPAPVVVGEEHVVVLRQEAQRSGRVRIRARRVGEVESSRPRSSRKIRSRGLRRSTTARSPVRRDHVATSATVAGPKAAK